MLQGLSSAGYGTINATIAQLTSLGVPSLENVSD